MLIQDNLHNEPVTLAEILAVAHPGVPDAVREHLKERLQQQTPGDDAVRGAKEFLEDHAYDFDALYNFLHGDAGQQATFIPSGRGAMIRKFSIAAVLATVLLTGGWFFWSQWQREKVLQAAELYEPGLPVFASLHGDKDFNEMMSAFRMEEGKHGLKYYSSLVETYPTNDTLQYFGGWLFYLDHQYDSAAANFEKASREPGSVYAQKAAYMQALSIYRMDDKTAARVLLEKIASDTGHTFCKEAGELLNERRLW